VLATCSTSTILAGCSSYAELIPFEQEKIEASGVNPLPQCEWPELLQGTIDGRDVVYMEAYNLGLQMRCQETGAANAEIAKRNGEIASEAVAAFNVLVDKVEMHQQNAQNELERVDDERKRKASEVLAYQGLLALVLIAVAL